MTIAKRIYDYRKERQLTRGQFAALTNVSHVSIWLWERERCYPRASSLIAVMDGLKLSDDERDMWWREYYELDGNE